MMSRWLDSMARGIASAGWMPSSLAGRLGIWTNAMPFARVRRLNCRTDTSSGPFNRRPWRRDRAHCTSFGIAISRPPMKTTNTAISDGRARSVSVWFA